MLGWATGSTGAPERILLYVYIFVRISNLVGIESIELYIIQLQRGTSREYSNNMLFDLPTDKVYNTIVGDKCFLLPDPGGNHLKGSGKSHIFKRKIGLNPVCQNIQSKYPDPNGIAQTTVQLDLVPWYWKLESVKSLHRHWTLRWTQITSGQRFQAQIFIIF